MLAVSDFLSLAKQNGKSIAISLYEVDHQEHAVDLLNPELPAISVLEDRGRIQFKGLSQVVIWLLVLASSSNTKDGIPKKWHCLTILGEFVNFYALQIPVNSISEFQQAYFTACATRKVATKKGNDLARSRTHVGLTVHVFSEAEGPEYGLVGKMNFVDLAGYIFYISFLLAKIICLWFKVNPLLHTFLIRL